MRTSTGYATRVAMDNTSGDRTPITQVGAADGKQAATTAGTQIGGYLLSGPDRASHGLSSGSSSACDRIA